MGWRDIEVALEDKDRGTDDDCLEEGGEEGDFARYGVYDCLGFLNHASFSECR